MFYKDEAFGDMTSNIYISRIALLCFSFLFGRRLFFIIIIFIYFLFIFFHFILLFYV